MWFMSFYGWQEMHLCYICGAFWIGANGQAVMPFIEDRERPDRCKGICEEEDHERR